MPHNINAWYAALAYAGDTGGENAKGTIGDPLTKGNMLDLKRPIYLPTAAYGHFGRSDIDLTWERTDKADKISQ